MVLFVAQPRAAGPAFTTVTAMCQLARRRAAAATVAAACVAAATPLARAAVTTDGTLGPRQTVTGPHYQVPASLGQQRGGNLFHSFRQFDLAKGETATFTGPAGTENVMARVTAGTASSIDGTIRCGIPAANFYLVNPAGVVFGPDAALDVQGAFAVTTAGAIRLADGTTFAAGQAAVAGGPPPVLTAAQPAAFGFLAPSPAGTSPAGITVGAAAAAAGGPVAGQAATTTLQVPAGRSLTIVGGAVQIRGARLAAPAGRVSVVAVGAGTPGAAVGDVPVAPDGSVAVPAPVPVAGAGGDIALAGSSAVDVSGPGGGAVVVRGRDLAADGLSVRAANAGTTDGAGVDVGLGGRLSLVNTIVVTDTTGRDAPGAAGDIVLSAAGGVSLDRSRVTALTTADRRGGDVRLDAGGGDLVLTTGCRVEAASRAALRPPGSIQLHGGAVRTGTGCAVVSDEGITVTADRQIVLDGGGAGGEAGLTATSLNPASGKGAGIVLAAPSVRVAGGAAVSTQAFGTGVGGDITVVADDVTVDGSNGTGFTPTGLTASIFGPGRAGDVTVRAGRSLNVVSGGTVSSSRSAKDSAIGVAGRVDLAADRITLDGAGRPTIVSAISVSQDTTAAGTGGDVTVRGRVVELYAGGRVEADTLGASRAGTIRVTADTFLADGGGAAAMTGLTAFAFTDGRGGDIRVDAGSVRLTGGAVVSVQASGRGGAGQVGLAARRALTLEGLAQVDSSTFGDGPGGDVALDVTAPAGRLTIAGGASVAATTGGAARGGKVSASGSRIVVVDGASVATSSAGAGAAGRVDLRADRTLRVGRANVSAEARASAGGDVTLTAGSAVRVGPGGVVTTRAGTTGGNIRVVAGDLFYVANASIVGRAGGDGGEITVDPRRVVLAGATVNALSRGRDVRVRIVTDGLLRSADTVILTNAPIDLPDTDLAGSLVGLAAAPVVGGARLAAQCGVRLGGDVSSFLLTGRGGAPPTPDGWRPAIPDAGEPGLGEPGR